MQVCCNYSIKMIRINYASKTLSPMIKNLQLRQFNNIQFKCQRNKIKAFIIGVEAKTELLMYFKHRILWCLKWTNLVKLRGNLKKQYLQGQNNSKSFSKILMMILRTFQIPRFLKIFLMLIHLKVQKGVANVKNLVIISRREILISMSGQGS